MSNSLNELNKIYNKFKSCKNSQDYLSMRTTRKLASVYIDSLTEEEAKLFSRSTMATFLLKDAIVIMNLHNPIVIRAIADYDIMLLVNRIENYKGIPKLFTATNVETLEVILPHYERVREEVVSTSSIESHAYDTLYSSLVPRILGGNIESLVGRTKTQETIEMLKVLEFYGFDLNGRIQSMVNAIDICASKGYNDSDKEIAEVALFLINKGVKIQNNNSRTPLDMAIENLNFSVAKILLEKGGVINLDTISKIRDNYVYDFLEENDFNFNMTNNSGHNILFTDAPEKVKEECIRRGTDVNHVSFDQTTPLAEALISKPKYILESLMDFLIKHGADINYEFEAFVFNSAKQLKQTIFTKSLEKIPSKALEILESDDFITNPIDMEFMSDYEKNIKKVLYSYLSLKMMNEDEFFIAGDHIDELKAYTDEEFNRIKKLLMLKL